MSISDDEIKVVKSFLDRIDVETAKRIVEKGDKLKALGKTEVILDYILPHAYEVLKNNNFEVKRKVNQQRLFTFIFEPFLFTAIFHEIDDIQADKIKGRISRSSLNPIWNWYKDNAMSKKSIAYMNAALQSLKEKDRKKYIENKNNFYKEANKEIASALKIDSLNKESSKRRVSKLESQLGFNAYKDLLDMSNILDHMDIINLYNNRLPKQIYNLSGAEMDMIKHMLFRFNEFEVENIFIPFAMIIKRMQKPAQIFRLVYSIFKIRNFDHLLNSKYSVVGDLVYFEIEEAIIKFVVNYRQHSLVNIMRKNFDEVFQKLSNWRNEVRTVSGNDYSKRLYSLVQILSDIFTEELEDIAAKINNVFFYDHENSIGQILHDRQKQIEFAKLNRAMLFYELSNYSNNIIPVNQVLNEIKPRVRILLGDAQNLVLNYAKQHDMTGIKEFRLLMDAMIRYERIVNSDQKAKIAEKNFMGVIEQRYINSA